MRQPMDFQSLDYGCEITKTSVDDYTVQVDEMDPFIWNGIIARFDDARLSQTWSYGAIRWGRGNLSHVVLKKDREVVAAAQVVIKTAPFLKAGLAYVKGGPLWQPRATGPSTASLRRLLQALREIYVNRRGLLLRVFAGGSDDGSLPLESIFAQEGFVRDLSIGRPSTAIVDLSHSLDDLRSSLRPTWRRNLVLAERKGLNIVEGSSDELFGAFATLYEQMLDRKSISDVVSIDQYRRMQADLPDSLKMRIMICEYRGEPVAGVVVPWLGSSAQNLLAATGDKALELRSSYLLHWRMLERLKTCGFRWYDLDAINHQVYPGISQFKLGLAGKLGREAEYFGQFECCTRVVSAGCVSLAEKAKAIHCATRLAWRQIKRRTRGEPIQR